MADQYDYLDLVGPNGENQLKGLIADMRTLITEITNANKAAKGFEFNIGAAKNLKDVTQQSQALVDANGRLVQAQQQVNTKYKESASIIAQFNGQSKEHVQVQQEVVKLKILEERLNRSTAKAVNDLTNEYAQMSKAQQELALKAKNYALTLGEMHPITVQAQQDADKLSAILKRLDKSTGDHRREVGNYGLAFNGLGNSIQQVARELPNFAISARTGFQALTNNLPILADEIARVRAQNKALQAEGKPTTSVLKQVAGAVFNWQTALIALITIMTAYGQEIGDFISKTFAGKTSLDKFKESAEQLNKALDSSEFKEAVTNVNELRINIDLAKQGFIAKEKVVRFYNETIGKTTGEVKSLEEAEKALQRNADTYIQMTLLKAAAASAQEEAVKALVEAEKQRRADERTLANLQASNKRDSAAGRDDGLGEFLERGRKNENAERKKDAEQRVKDLQSISNDFRAKAAKIAEQNNFDIFGGSQIGPEAGKAKAKKETAKRERKKEAEDFTKEMLEQRALLSEKEALIQKEISENVEKSLQERLDAYDNYTFNEINAAGLRLAGEANAEAKWQLAITKIVQQAVKDRAKIQDDEAKKQAAAAAQLIEGVGTPEAQRRLKGIQDKEQERKRANEQIAQQSIQLAGSLADVNSNLTQRRIKEIDAEIAAINKKTEAEIAGIEKSGKSAQEKEQAIAEAKARAEAQITQLENDKRNRLRRAAQVEKAVTIAQIIASTALAVVRQLGALPAGPQNIPLALAIGALGAGQLAAAIAAPLPQFAKGVDSSPEGLAITDEKGPEFYIERDGTSYFGSDKGPTVRYLKEGTKIIPHDEIMAMTKMYNVGLPSLRTQRGMDTRNLERKMDEVKQAIRNQPQPILSITGEGVRGFVKTGQNMQEWINNIARG